ncbi:MAG: exodeoxyribonuclease V subunit alpha [Actinomycetes bacterium]
MTVTTAPIADLVARGVLGSTEVHGADLVARRWLVDDADTLLAVAVAIWADRTGHVGLDLARVAPILDRARRTPGAPAIGEPLPDLPEAERWRSALLAHPTIVRALSDDPGTTSAALADQRPLVLWRDRLYTQRQFADERSVAEQVRQRSEPAPVDDRSAADGFLSRAATDLDPCQRAAVEAALGRRLTVITGGPGTGKTFTLARALGALLAAEPDLEVALAAPTGKAAKRMQEAISVAIGEGFGEVGPRLSALQPTTIHRLLGARGISTRFRHDAEHPLPHDVVVIDEASMVSLQLTARLLEAIRPDARVILIGDPDQLASVEAGSVLGDIVAVETGPVAASVTRLSTGHRSGESIITLAAAISAQDPAQVRAAFAAAPGELRLVESEHLGAAAASAELASATTVAVAARDAARSGDGGAAHAASASHRVLCGHRHGPTGVSTWNAWFERAIQCAGSAYAGRPVLVTVNDPITGLVNGDTGILIDRAGETIAWFPPRETEGPPVTYAPVQLPPTETAFAMTIHKSQGSEYDHVVVMLPPAGSPLLTRELLYTAVTRAKRSVTLIGSTAALDTAITTVTERASGLREALSG